MDHVDKIPLETVLNSRLTSHMEIEVAAIFEGVQQITTIVAITTTMDIEEAVIHKGEQTAAQIFSTSSDIPPQAGRFQPRHGRSFQHESGRYLAHTGSARLCKLACQRYSDPPVKIATVPSSTTEIRFTA